MSTSLLYHTQGIHGFLHVNFNFHNGVVVEEIARKGFRCPYCGSNAVSVYKRGTRVISVRGFVPRHIMCVI